MTKRRARQRYGNVPTAAATKATKITKTTKHFVLFVTVVIFVAAAVGTARLR